MKSIGIIAGNGRFPVLTAEEARRQNQRVVVCAIEDEADPSLEKIADVLCWVKVGQLKKLVSFFKAEGVHEAVMAGKIEKVKLFQKNVRPDLEMIKVLMRVRDHKDDSLLSGITDYLQKEGVTLMDSTLYLKQEMPGEGPLGKKKPGADIEADIKFGFEIAKALAGLDIGQTVIVKRKAVIAVEAIEGTDQAILRGGELGRSGITVIKVAKPNQDMRFDVPAIGLRTIENLIRVKAACLAFEAGKTLFIDKKACITQADRAGLILVGIKNALYKADVS